MPPPEYHRDAGCAEVSHRTAMTLNAFMLNMSSPPNFRYGVKSYRKLEYPNGLSPSNSPLIHTLLFCITPSNSIHTCRPISLVGTVKRVRYHATPLGKNAPAPPVLFVAANGPAMLQSCGKSTRRQFESSKSFASAPAGSPCKNSQPLSNGLTTRDWSAVAALATPAATHSAAKTPKKHKPPSERAPRASVPDCGSPLSLLLFFAFRLPSSAFIGCWLFDVGCWMFPAAFPLLSQFPSGFAAGSRIGLAGI